MVVDIQSKGGRHEKEIYFAHVQTTVDIFLASRSARQWPRFPKYDKVNHTEANVLRFMKAKTTRALSVCTVIEIQRGRRTNTEMFDEKNSFKTSRKRDLEESSAVALKES